MKVTLRKQIHSCFASVSSEDVWVNKVIEMPMIPLVGLTIQSDGGLHEEIEEVIYNISSGEIIAYVGEDETFYDVNKPSEYFAETPEFKALVQKYLDQGWEIKERREK
jgi:hypothetical protein